MAKFFFVLLVLVLLVGGGGYYNYQRNAPLDNELKDRPHKGLSDADLDALAAAYRGDVENRKKLATDKPSGTELMSGIKPGDYGERVDRFEKFQGHNRQWNQNRRDLAERQVALEAIDKELSIRARGLHKEEVRIWRRISTF